MGALFSFAPFASLAESALRQLFRAYAASLDIDLAFQDFEAELAGLPGRYAPPRGTVLLAFRGEDAVGCGALRPVDADTCEMKRLYVRPDVRGERLGRRLAERLCEEGRAAGYTRICLDTLATMTPALALYRSLGAKLVVGMPFKDIATSDSIFMRQVGVWGVGVWGGGDARGVLCVTSCV